MTAVRHNSFTGQSLVIGGLGDPAISTVARFPVNVMEVNTDGSLRSKRATGTVQFPDITFGYRVWDEGGLDGIVSVNTAGISGKTYVQLKKGTTTFSTLIARALNGKNAALARGDTFTAFGFHIIHGEADQRDETPRATYVADLEEWVSDYNSDVKAATGQSSDIVGFASQVCSWQHYNSPPAPRIGLAQLDAHRAGILYLTGPKYQFPDVDDVHLTDVGYYFLGEQHAAAHLVQIIRGGRWHPVAPRSVQRSLNVIDVRFFVPVPPLVFDTSMFPAQTNMGFAYYDDSDSASIVSVEILNADTVRITLDGTPTGTNQQVGYGTELRTDGAGMPGGNLHDSDPSTSDYDTSPLYNWGVHFLDPVGFLDTASDFLASSTPLPPPPPPTPTPSTGRAGGLIMPRRLLL